MPLLYSHNINDSARLAVWHITEDESFFKLHVHGDIQISHPHKWLQHLAGRYLLKILEPDFPVNDIVFEGRRPFLKSNAFYFSISHCGDFAAAIVSRRYAVGIDVELATEKLALLEKKYLNEEEQKIIHSTSSLPLLKRLTVSWSAKEAMFKWYQKGKVDFKKDMIIRQLNPEGECGLIIGFFGKEEQKELKIPFRFFDDLCLAYCYKK